MSIAKVTQKVDEVGAKSGLRVAYSNLAGLKTSIGLGGLGDLDWITKEIFLANIPTTLPSPIIYNLPAGSETPVIIDFSASTIKIGAASAVSIGSDLTNYRANPDIKFKLKIDATNSRPIGNEGWITNEEWAGSNAYASLLEVTLQPDTDTGLEGGLTLDDINIIIKA